MTGEVTVEQAVKEYGRRCQRIGLEHCSAVDLTDAMRHPAFGDLHEWLIGDLAGKHRRRIEAIEQARRMVLTLGVFRSVEEYRLAILASGSRIYESLGPRDEPCPGKEDNLLLNVPIASEPREVTAIFLTAAELGFQTGALLARVCDEGQSLGLGLLPAEAGLAIRYQLAIQRDPRILVAMEPIRAPNYSWPFVFELTSLLEDLSSTHLARCLAGFPCGQNVGVSVDYLMAFSAP